MADRLSFDTDVLPARDRFPVFCEELVRRYTGLDITAQDQINFHAAMELQRLGTTAIGRISTAPAIYSRTPDLVRDGDDGLCIVLMERGAARQTQRASDQKLEDGDAVICDCGYPGDVNIVAASRVWDVKIPRDRIARLVPRFTRLAGMKLDRNPVARRLLFGYLGAAQSVELPSGGPVTQLYEDHVIDLVALAIGATRDAAEVAQGRGARVARLLAIKRDIMEGLSDTALSLAAVAARHGITPRYVSMLFEDEGTTFTTFVIEQRLVRAHRMLSDPRYLPHKISAIVWDCGFHDLSWFHRTFRRRYGVTPSDIREAVRKSLDENRSS